MKEKAEKKEIIAKFARKDGDTGSPEVQIALLTERINEVTEHLKSHRKDISSRRGLLALVGRRRKLMNYLGSKDSAKLKAVSDSLDLKKAK